LYFCIIVWPGENRDLGSYLYQRKGGASRVFHCASFYNPSSRESTCP
jgi:hypothetical protein